MIVLKYIWIIQSQLQTLDLNKKVFNMRLNNKRVIITGAGSGIGRACAQTFNREGANIVLADINGEGLAETKDSLNTNRKSEIGLGDVSKKDDAKSLIELTEKSLGGVDILINSAGVSPRNAPEEYDFEQIWDWVIDVNLKGTYLMSHFAVEKMKGSGGSILNLASIIGLVGYNQGMSTGLNPYPHSKGGVVQMTRDMAVGFAKSNIRVNALCPGFSKTNLTEILLKEKKSLDHIESLHPMGRLAEPEEISNAALFLSSDEASFITGVCLPVDGGYTAQ
ncbi:MAG: short-chain dehydrogenase [Dehalococcoidia bacterium]|nr:short-chain dehydrogenase [Dehalococcoidia bacterium]